MGDAQKKSRPPADAAWPFHGFRGKRAEGIAVLAMAACVPGVLLRLEAAC